MLYKSCKCNVNWTCCHGNQVVVLGRNSKYMLVHYRGEKQDGHGSYHIISIIGAAKK